VLKEQREQDAGSFHELPVEAWHEGQGACPALAHDSASETNTTSVSATLSQFST